MLFLRALQVCILLTVILTVDNYVLFSANLDDFHKLAQKFVPENLAMKLTELVSESSVSKRHDKDGEWQRSPNEDTAKTWHIENINYYYERNTERNEVKDVGVKSTQTTEGLFEPDRMHDNDYDRLGHVTFPRIMGKRYKTVQRMATTKEWFEEPPSFLRTMLPKRNDPETPSHSIYYKDKVSSDRVKQSSPERDVSDNYERNKENSKIIRKESSDGKQVMQYFPVENKPSRYKNQSKSETEGVRVNGRDVSKIKKIKEGKLDNKGKDAIFDTIFMAKKKDSYEDYVTPKKDDDYLINDGIGTGKKISSTQRSLNDEISPTPKSWKMISLYSNTERGHKNSPLIGKVSKGSIIEDSNHRNAPAIRERPNTSVERDLSDRIATTKKQPTSSEQRNEYDGFPEEKRPKTFSVQRQRTEKPTTTTQETFPDYTDREWLSTDRKTTDRYTTEKDKITEDYVLDDEDDKLQLFEKAPIQARTESLLFDSKELEYGNNTTRYTMKGTGIPTREYYNMSTPDYYKKLPRIVEKYDFNEPIPEADRERENIDDGFDQEPARVNHKVKHQRGKTNVREKTGNQENGTLEKIGRLEKMHRDKRGRLENRSREKTGLLQNGAREKSDILENGHQEKTSYLENRHRDKIGRLESMSREKTGLLEKKHREKMYLLENRYREKIGRLENRSEEKTGLSQNGGREKSGLLENRHQEKTDYLEKSHRDKNGGLESKSREITGLLEKKHREKSGRLENGSREKTGLSENGSREKTGLLENRPREKSYHWENRFREKTGRLENSHRDQTGPIQKRNQEKSGPLESILENIGFQFKVVSDTTP